MSWFRTSMWRSCILCVAFDTILFTRSTPMLALCGLPPSRHGHETRLVSSGHLHPLGLSGIWLEVAEGRRLPVYPLLVSKANTLAQLVLATLVLAELGLGLGLEP